MELCGEDDMSAHSTASEKSNCTSHHNFLVHFSKKILLTNIEMDKSVMVKWTASI